MQVRQLHDIGLRNLAWVSSAVPPRLVDVGSPAGFNLPGRNQGDAKAQVVVPVRRRVAAAVRRAAAPAEAAPAAAPDHPEEPSAGPHGSAVGLLA